jgi:hypothetical protein
MAAKHILGLILTTLVLAFLPVGTAHAAEPATAQGGERKTSGFAEILGLISNPNFPSLSGLIQPEKMGVLTDNTCQIRDNEVEPEVMSGNKVQILSGIRILSGISVDVRVTIRGGEGSTKGKARKADGKRRSKKSKRNKARSQSAAATPST